VKSNHYLFCALRSAISAQARKDSSQLRGELFEVLTGHNRTLNTTYKFFSAYPSLGALVSLFYGVYSAVRMPHSSGESLAFFTSENERNALKLYMNSTGKTVKLLKVRAGVSLSNAACVTHFKKGIRLYKFFKSMQGRYPLFVVMRCSEAYFLFALWLEAFQEKSPKEIFFSSEGNPHGRAIVSLGQVFNFQTHFVTHAPSVIEPLSFKATTGNFVGAAGLEEYLQQGAQFEKVVVKNYLFPLYGFPVRKIPADGALKICLCLSKETDTMALESVIANIKKIFRVGRIAVRAHPSRLVTASHGYEELPADHADLARLSEFDLMVAGSSNVHFEALTRGVPTIFSGLLDKKGLHTYKFIAGQLVPSIETHQTVELINQHYQDPHWYQKLEYYIKNEKV
jgi:hypothetical protein